ncbi:uncharacterized protein HD556DRAFT_1537766, partial [Suillus plorans]
MIAKHLSGSLRWLSHLYYCLAQGHPIVCPHSRAKIGHGSVFRIQERLLFPQSAGSQIIREPGLKEVQELTKTSEGSLPIRGCSDGVAEYNGVILRHSYAHVLGNETNFGLSKVFSTTGLGLGLNLEKPKPAAQAAALVHRVYDTLSRQWSRPTKLVKAQQDLTVSWSELRRSGGWMLPFIRFRPQRHISRPCASFPLRSDDLFTMSFLAFGLIGNVRLGGFGRRQRFLSTSTTYARLISFRPGMSDARRRLQWASSRVTTLQEVVAYSLFGIFSVHVHLQTSPSSTGSDNLPSSTAVFRPISLLTPLLHTPFHPCPNVLLLV